MRTMARTAVVAGTATAVSGRVARRQQGKFADQEAAAAPAQAPVGEPVPDKVEQLKKTIENAKDPNVLRKIATVLQQTLLAEESKNESLREKVQEEAAHRNCKQCGVAKKDTVLMPCMHLLYCRSCVASADACPACKEPVEGMVQVVLSAPAH